MTNTPSAWTSTTVGKRVVHRCTSVAATADKDCWTLKTPDSLDTSKAWTLGLMFSATIDTGQVVVVDLWVGHDTSFALSGDDSTVAATAGTGGFYKQLIDDAVLAVTPVMYFWQMDPNLAVADVVTVAAINTGLKVKIPVAPYYIFNIDGATTFSAAATCTWVIIQ